MRLPRLKLIADFGRRIHRFWSVRIQVACALLTGFLWIDPGTLLAWWSLMPDAIRDRLPGNFISTIGATLFALNLLTILARGVQQPKLEKTDGN